jgi:hypothetical protein
VNSALKSSDLVREFAHETYIGPARRRREKTVTINVGQVQKGVGLQNRVSLVCQALKSDKFLRAHGLKLISKTGPPSGQSTTVTYTYEFLHDEPSGPGTLGGPGSTSQSRQDAWNRLRGALKDVFAEYGGGEAYLRAERASFRDADERK